jgi:glutaredoxin
MALYSVQRGVCPGCGFHQPHHLRFEVDHIVALSDDGEDETRNLQLLCPYCNRVKATQGSHGFRMKMAELRAHNVGTGVMVDEREATLTGRRLAQYHLVSGDAVP